ncbi:glycosyltransferase [Pseudothauera lacus]|uniref:Glycosyl transferase n=1 Tax=Pseudothauera lacus TaxID=2136175 RepID=A0A2T4IK30_9RHOO|nr:glycosyltransferase [Pseudothauera lacus]PTD98119.1 glycosyl transferase [Pseudothauera lacus]
MQRLLSLNSYHYRRGGSDVVYMEHDAMFRGLGWDTAQMSMHHPRNVASPWSDYFVDEIEFGNQYGLLEKVGMAGKVIYSLEAQRKLRALLERFPADVAHVHCIYHHLSPSVLPVLRKRGIPVVLTAHDLKIACPAYKMLNAGGICEQCKGGRVWNVVRNRCLRGGLATSALVGVESAVHKVLGVYRNNLARVVAPSRFYMDKLMEWGWPREMLSYIPNYVDAQVHRAAFDAGDYFLYFGRLAVEKGVRTLIRAAVKAGASVKVVGTGPLEAELQAEAAGTRVEFMGFRSGDELWELVRGARAVVLPSEWYENAPMSVLEAYACGKPVIGARIGGIPEMIVADETGWLFESGDVEGLAAELEEVGRAPGGRLAEMGRAARELVERDFTRDRYRDEMLALYGSLVGAAR